VTILNSCLNIKRKKILHFAHVVYSCVSFPSDVIKLLFFCTVSPLQTHVPCEVLTKSLYTPPYYFSFSSSTPFFTLQCTKFSVKRKVLSRPSVRLSLRMENPAVYWTHFDEIVFEFFRKSVEKIQHSSKSDKNNSTLHGDVFIFIKTSH
jgi:hypothetical protein